MLGTWRTPSHLVHARERCHPHWHQDRQHLDTDTAWEWLWAEVGGRTSPGKGHWLRSLQCSVKLGREKVGWSSMHVFRASSWNTRLLGSRNGKWVVDYTRHRYVVLRHCTIRDGRRIQTIENQASKPPNTHRKHLLLQKALEAEGPELAWLNQEMPTRRPQ